MVTSYTAVDHTLFPPSTVDWSNGQLSESHPLLFIISYLVVTWKERNGTELALPTIYFNKILFYFKNFFFLKKRTLNRTPNILNLGNVNKSKNIYVNYVGSQINRAFSNELIKCTHKDWEVRA